MSETRSFNRFSLTYTHREDVEGYQFSSILHMSHFSNLVCFETSYNLSRNNNCRTCKLKESKQ